MVELNINNKRKIDNSVRILACSDMKRVSANYISRTERINIDVVRNRLLQLVDDEQLFVNFDVICPDCYDVLKTFKDSKKISLNEELYCPNSDKEILVEPSNIFVNFTPNKKYFNSELCKELSIKKKQ